MATENRQTPEPTNLVVSSGGFSNITPRPKGRPRKFPIITRRHNVLYLLSIIIIYTFLPNSP